MKATRRGFIGVLAGLAAVRSGTPGDFSDNKRLAVAISEEVDKVITQDTRPDSLTKSARFGKDFLVTARREGHGGLAQLALLFYNEGEDGPGEVRAYLGDGRNLGGLMFRSDVDPEEMFRCVFPWNLVKGCSLYVICPGRARELIVHGARDEFAWKGQELSNEKAMSEVEYQIHHRAATEAELDWIRTRSPKINPLLDERAHDAQ